MRSFLDYVKDHRQNTLYYGVKEYALPDYFMSFTEAKWENIHKTKEVPNGIIVFNILETMGMWPEVDGVRTFTHKTNQEKVYILKAIQEGAEYTARDYDVDLVSLRKHYDFRPNKKLLSGLRRAGQLEAAQKEKTKWNTMIMEATASLGPDSTASGRLFEVTKWIAAGNRNPKNHFEGNAPQRWNNILRKIGHTCLAEDQTAIFLDTNAFEVIDEICN